MNLQQYLSIKQELAATVTLVQALVRQIDRMEAEIHELRQLRPVGRPRKTDAEAATAV